MVLRDTQASPVLFNHEFYLITENQLSEDDSRQCSSLRVISSRHINYVSVANNSISIKTFLKSLEANYSFRTGARSGYSRKATKKKKKKRNNPARLYKLIYHSDVIWLVAFLNIKLNDSDLIT